MRYTYQDWKNGNINWMTLESKKYEENLISKECLDKIQIHQKDILEAESKKILENLISNYNLKLRADTNRGSAIKMLLDTIQNLLTSSPEKFKDVTILDEEEAYTQLIPIEYKMKKILPLGWVDYTEQDIKGIQKQYQQFLMRGTWNTEVVETPIMEQLSNNVEYRHCVLAKTYHDFAFRLRQYSGIIVNTFISDSDTFDLYAIRVKLREAGFIKYDYSKELFVKAFTGYYLMKHEKIKWLKPLDCLNYFIVSLEKTKEVKFPKEYKKWGTVCNCFSSNGSDINQETLRKATHIDKYPIEKAQIDHLTS
ncbi:hypothetical protein [Flagellimonas eckloniae]|uniref:Uncharacterized protein n=1 Tax=Flagellimonas eckloniae TaxID=346185 RepID=A0A0N8WG13_9FLAO|nr:hypothetical protein [Allomuricauda eckloniae]KQC30219.1 hypothetical protein AAY42_10280 [Allomuricauda eckloniae]